jgi:hypothetical protein
MKMLSMRCTRQGCIAVETQLCDHKHRTIGSLAGAGDGSQPHTCVVCHCNHSAVHYIVGALCAITCWPELHHAILDNLGARGLLRVVGGAGLATALGLAQPLAGRHQLRGSGRRVVH